MSTLQERLRERVVTRWIHSTGTPPHASGTKPDALCTEAADRLDALERERDEYKMAAKAEADFADQYKAKHDALEREVQALRADAERWRYARKALTWAGDWDGEVRWTMLLTMPEPDVSAAGLTSDSVAQELDAAIDAARSRK